MIPNHPNIILFQKRVFLLTFMLFIGCEVTMKKHTEEDEVYLHHLRLALLSYSFVFIQCDDLCPVCLWPLVSAEPYVAVAKKVDVHSKYPPHFMLSLTANNFLFFLLSNTFKLPLVFV